MRTRTFYDARHAMGYMVGTYVMYDGRLHYVSDLVNREALKPGTFGIALVDVEKTGNKINAVATDDPKLDMSPVPLGWVQNEAFGVYQPPLRVLRAPRRQWKIGTNCKSLYVSDLNGRWLRHGDPDLLRSIGFIRAVHNQYPSFDRAVERAEAQDVAIAFSRKFVVNPNGSLYHLMNNRPVGHVDEIKAVRLDNRYAYLQEALDEEINREH